MAGVGAAGAERMTAESRSAAGRAVRDGATVRGSDGATVRGSDGAGGEVGVWLDDAIPACRGASVDDAVRGDVFGLDAGCVPSRATGVMAGVMAGDRGALEGAVTMGVAAAAGAGVVVAGRAGGTVAGVAWVAATRARTMSAAATSSTNAVAATPAMSNGRRPPRFPSG